jgi:hypothetical protein
LLHFLCRDWLGERDALGEWSGFVHHLFGQDWLWLRGWRLLAGRT